MDRLSLVVVRNTVGLRIKGKQVMDPFAGREGRMDLFNVENDRFAPGLVSAQ